MWTWLTSHFIEGWREAYRFASVWLALAFSTISTVVVANQGTYFALVAYLPRGPMRFVALAVLWAVLIIVPVVTRLWSQKRSG